MPQISPNDANYNWYVDAVNHLKMAINTAADPCNDFFTYSCGNYPSNMPSTGAIVDRDIYTIIGKQIMNSTYQQPNVSWPH